MKKILIIAVLLLATPALSFAANVGECGWGSKLMHGNEGIAPQVLAVTTNGTSGNQTFGITTGTSGCSQDGVVRSNWKTAMFIDANKNKLARDISVGNGETLDSLAQLLGVREEHKELFVNTTKSNFDDIFASENATTAEIMIALKNALESESALANYSQTI